VNDIVVSANNGLRCMRDETGVYRSLNGGTSWAAAAGIMANNGCTDLAIRTDAATDTVFGLLRDSGAGEVYRNTDGGGAGTWDVVLNEAGIVEDVARDRQVQSERDLRPRHGRCRRHVQAGPAGGLTVDHRRRERNLDGAGAQHVPDEAQHAACSRIRAKATKAACASA